MGERKPIRQHDSTSSHCPQCQAIIEIPMEQGKIPDGIPWKCDVEGCGAIGNVDVFAQDGTFVAVQRGGFK